MKDNYPFADDPNRYAFQSPIHDSGLPSSDNSAVPSAPVPQALDRNGQPLYDANGYAVRGTGNGGGVPTSFGKAAASPATTATTATHAGIAAKVIGIAGKVLGALGSIIGGIASGQHTPSIPNPPTLPTAPTFPNAVPSDYPNSPLAGAMLAPPQDTTNSAPVYPVTNSGGALPVILLLGGAGTLGYMYWKDKKHHAA